MPGAFSAVTHLNETLQSVAAPTGRAKCVNPPTGPVAAPALQLTYRMAVTVLVDA